MAEIKMPLDEASDTKEREYSYPCPDISPDSAECQDILTFYHNGKAVGAYFPKQSVFKCRRIVRMEGGYAMPTTTLADLETYCCKWIEITGKGTTYRAPLSAFWYAGTRSGEHRALALGQWTAHPISK